MNRMRDPETILAAWLDEGPTDLPGATRRAIVTSLPTTPQARRGLLAPWRFQTMTRSLVLIGVIGAIVVLAIGGFAVLGGGHQPTNNPVPSVLPTSTGLSRAPGGQMA